MTHPPSIRPTLLFSAILWFAVMDGIAQPPTSEDTAETPEPAASPAESVVEPAPPVSKYQPIWERSPFTLSSASVEEPIAGFAENLAVVAIGKINEEDYVRVLDKVTKDRYTIMTGSDYQGISLVTVAPNKDPLQATAKLKKGNEEAVIRYDPTLLKAVGNVPNVVPPAGQKVTPPTGNRNAPQINRNTNANQGNQPRKRRRIVIPSRPPAR